jgi:hypothetical protein
MIVYCDLTFDDDIDELSSTSEESMTIAILLLYLFPSFS